jgi:outer membrane protein OmpA-like peptidoglycan-associated protein
MNRQWIKKIAVVTLLLSSTSGCAMYELEELRHTTPSGSPFQQQLAKLYMDFATQDEKGYDWFNSWYFADKGLRSAYGKAVMPEDPKDWNISKEALPAIQDAHGKLLVALTPQNEDKYPKAAAEAQVYFDCWMQRQDEVWQLDRIAYCREGFEHALSELGAPVKASEHEKTTTKKEKVVHKKKAKAKKHEHVDAEGNNVEPTPADHALEEKPKAETPKKAAAEAETLSYVVFFAGDRPVITDPGTQVLEDVVKSLRGARDYEVILKSGAGSDASSKLFTERAEAVSKRLIEGGVKPDSIMTSSGKATASKHIEIFISQ